MKNIKRDREFVLITGDTHGRFARIREYLWRNQVAEQSLLIILGDAGINYFGGARDRELKKFLETFDITLFCIHGNHERRPETIPTYKEECWRGGVVYVEPDYPHLLFAKDGEVYDICGKQTLVIGGAYSVDREYRIARNPHNPEWWPDEQPSEEIKQRVRTKLDSMNWKADVVLSHTVPRKYEPVETFLKWIDQSSVDKSTEDWLQEIEDNLTYEHWYAGHYHIQKTVDRLEMMYENVHGFDDYQMN